MEFVAELMAKMTLDENRPIKSPFWNITTGAANSSNVAKNIEEGKVGGFIQYKSVKKLKKSKRLLLKKSRLKSITFGYGRNPRL
jgi:beta-glucosidase